jgi:hypothetical protein
MSKHNIEEKSEVTKQKREALDAQPRIDVVSNARAAEDSSLDYMLLYATPLERVEDKIFKAVHRGLAATRKTLRARLLDHSTARHKAALATFTARTCTLAIDAGTIWRKYLCVALLSFGSPPLVLALVSCQESMTALWTKEVLEAKIAELRGKKVLPIAVVSDNAANMIAATAQVPLLATRCLAHSVQLAVNDAFVFDAMAKRSQRP